MKLVKKERSPKRQKRLNILVIDSYHTKAITETLQGYFGSRAICYEYAAPTRVKIDVFFLSGRDILSDGPEALRKLRERSGSTNCKIIAVSALSEYLDRIRERSEFSVDGTIMKGTLVDGLTEREPDPLDVVLKKILKLDHPPRI